MRYVLVLLGVILVVGGACGSDDDGGDDDGGPTLTIDVSMGDNFFDPDTLTVPAGAAVTINLTNDGLLVHNLRIAGPDGEYVTSDDTLSDYVQAMGSASLEWTAPDDPAEYKFRCELHPDEMVGTITVE